MNWRKAYFLLLPLGFLLLLAAAVQALPGYVSSPAHRVQMERLASSLTGRDVRIGGDLSLGLFPLEVTATGITISGPDAEVITARSLAMEMSLAALLHGEIAAQNLTLNDAAITLPWPLPGGPKAITPPPLLAALHADVTKATLHLGGLTITGISASAVTAPGGAVTIAGTGALLGLPASLTLSLAPPDLTGAAPLSLDLAAAGARMNLNGTLASDGTAAGQANFSLPTGLSGTAQLTVSADALAAQALNLQQGSANATGEARLAFAPLALSATLTGQNLNLSALPVSGFTAPLPITVTLTANAVTLAGQTYPALSARFVSGPDGTALHDASLSLPGGGTVAGDLAIAPSGALSGQASLTAPDLTALLAGFALPALPNWPGARLSARLAGTAAAPALQNISGTLGPDHVSGTLVFTASHASGALAFDHLALAPLSAWLSHRPAGRFTADAEITAGLATAGPVQMKNFLLDGALDGTLNIRRVSASLYGGMAAGSFTLDSSGQVTSAHGFLDIPSAAPLAATLLPPQWTPPKSVLAGHLALELAARGPATALATSAVLTLGDFTITAAPVLDLVHLTAAGPFSLRTPNAILALQMFGLPAGLPFPGAGSASLRARFTASPTGFGLPDFDLSFGALTATGRLMMTNGTLAGNVAADTLVLPPLPSDFQFPSLPALTGKVTFSASHVLYGAAPLLDAANGSLIFAPGAVDFALTSGALAGGSVSGTLHTALAAGAAPRFTVQAKAQNLDAAALALPLAFPYKLLSGQVSGTADLTASGFSPKIWLATVSGTAALAASDGTLRGLSLGGVVRALGQPGALAALRGALTGGATPFARLAVSATLAQGNAALTSGQFVAPAGGITMQAGSYIDLYDQTLGLRLAISPAVRPALTITQMTLGSWARPKHIAHLAAAVAWTPEGDHSLSKP